MRRAHMNLISCKYSLEKANTWNSWSSSSRQGAQYSKVGCDSSYSEESVKKECVWRLVSTISTVFLFLKSIRSWNQEIRSCLVSLPENILQKYLYTRWQSMPKSWTIILERFKKLCSSPISLKQPTPHTHFFKEEISSGLRSKEKNVFWQTAHF